jgi:hypothetical protein
MLPTKASGSEDRGAATVPEDAVIPEISSEDGGQEMVTQEEIEALKASGQDAINLE